MPTMVEIWKAEGELKGKAEGKAETLLTILRTRFNAVPKEIESSLGKMTDPTALDSWVAFAVTCKSLGEFAKALK